MVPVVRCSIVALVVAGLLAPGSAAAEDSAPTTLSSLELAVSGRLDEVDGLLRCTVTNVLEEPLDRIYLWLPFNRLARPPEGMDQRNAHWIYPRAFSPGSIDVSRIELDGAEVPAASLVFPDDPPPAGLGEGQRVLASLPLPTPLAPGAAATLVVRFRTEVPRRFGRLGRARGVLTLAGGFYPQPAALTSEGWQLDQTMIDGDWDVAVSAPGGHHVVVNGGYRVVPAEGPRRALNFELRSAPYVALVVARRFHRQRVRVGDRVIEFLSLRRRYIAPRREPGPHHASGLPADAGDATRWDWQGRALATARTTLQVLAERGLEPPPGQVVRFVEVPLRLEIVSPIPSGILISDRAYRVTPLEQFFRFYDFQIARAVGWLALEESLAREPVQDRMWALDFLAAAGSDAFAQSSYGGRGPGLRRLLRIGAFIPEIDQLLYSPLIEFRHLFLRPFRDEDPLRDEPWRLASAWPRGAVLHDKLVDLLGQEAVQTLLSSYAADDRPLRQLVAESAGEEMEWFFDQWLGIYPSVNYRLTDVSTEELDGGEGRRYRHRIVVERQGDAIREPVEVRVHYRRGQPAEDLTWDGRGTSGELTVESDHAILRVELDPRRRLLEDADLAEDNPRFDNISPARWRMPVLNGLLLYLSAAESEWYALVDFSLRRQYDARNAFRLRLEYDPRGFSGDLFYQRGLGRLLNLNRASWVLSAGVNASRIFGDFAQESEPATAVGASVSLSHDTRWYFYDPMEGWGMSLSIFGGGWFADEGDRGWSVGSSGRVAGHLTPRVGHTFTGFLGAGIVLGEPLPEQLQSISDRMMLRAFEADETLGRARIYAGVEYRWTVIHDLDVNLFHLAWWRALFLAMFVAGGTVSETDGLDGMFTTDRLFTEVGVGLRGLFEIGGVQPYIIAVDLALPITPRERYRCVADLCAARNPIGLYVSIQHTM